MFKLIDLLNVYREELNAEGGEGGGGSEPEKKFTQADIDAAIAALKAKNDELISEKRNASKKAKEEEEARHKAEQERLKESGKLEEFERNIRGEYERIIAEKDEALKLTQGGVVAGERKAIIGSLAADFIDPSSADLIGQFVKVDFEDGKLATKFVGLDGTVITTDAGKFKEWMAKHPAISHLMKAELKPGGGAGGSKVRFDASGSGDKSGIEKTRADLRNRLNSVFKD